MKKIIFVCLGNICRSPLAHGIAQYEAQKRDLKIKIDSAGTSNYHNGEPPCRKSINIANRNGINISKQKSQHINEFKLKEYDLVIALDKSNFNDLKKIPGIALKKLGDFGLDGQDIPDPYYFNSKKELKEVYDLIELAVSNLLDFIEKK